AQTPLAISDFRLDTSGKASLRVPYAAGNYFILYRGIAAADIREPAAVEDGPLPLNAAQLELIENRPPLLAPARFYRVERVLLSAAKDVDSDGLDDAYELRYRPRLDPLDPADAHLNPDNDSLDTLAEYRAGTDPFTANPPPRPATPTLIPPPEATTSSLLTLTGSGPKETYIRVEGGAALATNNVRADGTFELTVPLSPNRLNRMFVTAVTAKGETSAGGPVEVLQDSQPPTLFIDFPAEAASLSVAQFLVAGRVGDSLSGYRGLRVWVHSAPSEGAAPLAATVFPLDSPLGATVDVGIGPNGTFERGNVPLAEGANTITVIAADQLGNRTIRRVAITGGSLQGPRLVALSGDGQKTNVLRRVAEPLLVRAQQADGTPLANTTLLFEVSRSDGRLLPTNDAQLAAPWTNSPSASANGAMKLQLRTDSTGEARVMWTLGSDAGCANNRVSVSSAETGNNVYFCASATANPARQLNIGSGNHQKVETGAAAAEPLRVWASDGLNPAVGTPVTFRVVQGGGKLVPGGHDGTLLNPAEGALPVEGVSNLTIEAGITGHASVGFIAGLGAGQNVIEASFPGQFGLPARFIIYGVVRDPSQPGDFSGLVLDNTSSPIGHATCRLTVANFDQAVMSDAQGRFRFENVPGGMGHLFVNGTTATSLFTNAIPTNSFPSLSYSVVTVPNAQNSLPTPVLLPRLDPKNARAYDGTIDLVLTCEGIEGLKMTIQANSMSHPDGTRVTPDRPAVVSLNQVHHDEVPMPMPDGVAPPFAWTFQPGGAHFDVERPVKVEYPNMSALPPGAIAYFLSFNHDTERFEIVASGHVTDDGSTIVTDPGSGLTLSGWGCNCPPYSVAGDCEQSEDPCGDSALAAKALERQGAKPTEPEVCVQCDNPFQRYDPNLGYCRAYTCGPTEDVFFDALDWETYFLLKHLGFQIATDVEIFFFEGVYGLPGSDQAARVSNAHRHIWWQCQVTKNYGAAMAEAWASAHEGGRYAAGGYRNDWSCGAPIINAPCTEDHLLDLWNNQIGRDLGTDLNVSDCATAAAAAAFGNLPGYPPPALYLTPEMREQIDAAIPLCVDNDIQLLHQKVGRSASPPAACPTLSVEPSQVVLKAGETAQLTVKVTDCNGVVTDVTQDTSKTVYFIWDGVIQTSASGLITPLAPGEATLNVYCRFDPAGPVLTKDILVRVLDAKGNAVAPVGRGAYITNVWQVSINGQVGIMTGRRGFYVANVSAPDQFSDAGAGSSPDFVGDDYVRAVAVTSIAGETLYAYSDFFKIRQGQVVPIDGLTYTRVPPRQPQSLEIRPDAKVMTALGASNRLHVAATFADGTLEERNSAEAGTTFRVSNFAIATVDATGVVVARAPGAVMVTASNEGATAVAQIIVAPGDLLTTVVGQAVDANGGAISGAEVILRTGDLDRRAVTGLDGSFRFSEVPSSFGPVAVTVIQPIPGGRLAAVAKSVAAQPGGETRIPALVVAPVVPRMRSDFAAGSRHTAALRSDRSLWVWGDGSFGQIGNSARNTVEEPVMIGADLDWESVACGWSHTLAVKRDGLLWAWGLNTSGQLGNGTSRNATAPVRIGSDQDWKILSGGATHTLALNTDGSLWAWGGNQRGQLGTASQTQSNTPTQVGAQNDWLMVAAGESHSAALRKDGSLWAWGANNNGQLGDGTNSDRNAPVRIGTENDWVIVACGAQHTVALKVNGSLWAWGLNFEGQSGNGAAGSANAPMRVGTDDDWMALAGGGAHTVAIRVDGSLWAWGRNAFGQLGNGSDQRMAMPVRVGSAYDWLVVACGGEHTAALKTDASLWAWGEGLSGQLGNRPVANLDVPAAIGAETNWQTISCGELHTLALKTDGSLWAFGYNVNGQLGLGNLLGTPTPTRVGSAADWVSISAGAAGGRHSLALKANGSLWAWGWNREGQLGLGGNADTASPAQVGADLDWMSVASGRRHSVALKKDGSLWAWGANTFEQLGVGTIVDTTKPARIGGERDWREVACGESRTWALKTDGSLWAWGDNLEGRLGIGSRNLVRAPTRIGTDQDWRSVVAGPRHTVALRTSGSLWAWGDNNHGQLGDGTLQSADAPRQIGTETDWMAAACGAGHTVALKRDGSLWAWGFNFDGQLGNGTRNDSRVPVRIGTAAQWQAIACGGDSTVTLQADGAVFGWGSNSRGQIGQPVPWLPRPVPGGNNWGL
ncbi:MAG: hypothetical protein L0Z50_03435, partial [Verrucomicrobiales bacterium]|nr:hypothetical protein [Verrucomicrobiales bacterium]